MRLGFVGAGRMGQPMVRRLIRAGHQVRVLGRSADTRRVLVREGAQVTSRIAEVGEGADAVVICVFTDEQVLGVCLDGGLLGGMRSGSTLIVHTTGNPRTVEIVGARAAAHGIHVIDSPVSGGPHDIAAGRLTLFVGGADDDVARVKPVLRSYGDPVLHVGPLGAGQRVKLINNTLFAAQIGLLAEAIRLGGQLGVDESVLLEALPHASAASRALSGVAAKGSVAAFAEAVGGFVGKDVEIARKVAAELGGDLGALDPALRAGPK